MGLEAASEGHGMQLHRFQVVVQPLRRPGMYIFELKASWYGLK